MGKRNQWMVALAIGFSVATLVQEASADNRGRGNDNRGRGNGNGGGRASVPEIPVGGAAGALVLLLGGTAIALDRRRRQAK
jgi:hypothetical protein